MLDLRRAAPLGLFLILALVHPDAKAADWSAWGGQTLPETDTAIRTSIGWPDVNVAYHYPLNSELEIAPKFGVLYGFPLVLEEGLSCCSFANLIGSEVRWTFMEAKGFHLAAKGELGLILAYDIPGYEGMSVGTRVSPGLAVDYSASDEVNVIGGIEAPIDIYFAEPALAFIPFLFRAGLEFMPDPSFSGFALVGMGPGVAVAGDNSSSGFAMEGRVGLTYRFQ